MSRTEGVFSFADNFECSLAAPLDARMTTPLKSQLTGFTGMYLGMLVVVTEDTDNNGLYRLKQNDGTSLTDWEQIGTGGSISLATSNALGGVKIGYTKSGTNYPVELDAEKAYVNISEITGIASNSTAITNLQNAGYITASSLPSGNELVPTITTDGYFLRSDKDGTTESLTWAEVPTLPVNVPPFHTAISGATDGHFLKVATESQSKVVKYESVSIPSGNDLVPTITTDGYFLKSISDGGGDSLTWAEVPTLPENVPPFHTAITGATDGHFLKVATESQSKVVKYESVTIPSGNDLVPTITTDGYFLRSDKDGTAESLTWAEISIPTDNSSLTNGADYITASSTDTLTNKTIGYTQISGVPSFITASSTDTLTNKSMSYSQLTGTPDIPENLPTFLTAISSADIGMLAGVYDDNGTKKIAYSSPPPNLPPFEQYITSASDGQFLKVTQDSNNNLLVKYETVTIPTDNDALSNGANYITASSTDTLTNKTIGYTQISGVPSFITASSTDTLTNKTIGYTQISGVPSFITASSTDTLTNKTIGYTQISGVPSFITASSTDTLTNKTIGYTQISGVPSFITASSTDTLTNKTIGYSQLTGVPSFITADITNQVTITTDTTPQLTIKPSSSTGEPGVLRIEGRRDTSTSSNSSAIEFYNNDGNTTSLFGRIVTRRETSSSNVGKIRFQVSATGSNSTDAVLDLTSERVAKFLGDADFANIPTHGDYTLLSTNSSLDYGKLTSVPSTFAPVLATSSIRGGIKIGYSQSGTTYPVQLSGEQAYVDIDGFNSDLSSYSQSGQIQIESTDGAVILKANGNAQLRSVNSDDTLTKLYTDGTNGHIYGFTKNIQRLLISANARINLIAENGIWLKCMADTDTIGHVNFGQKPNDRRYHTIETYTSGVTGEPYMSFKIHDGVDDSDDNTQVTPLKLYGDKLIQGTHMELLSDIHTDGGANDEPNLLVTTSSVSGFDSAISIRGSRNGSTTSNQANLLFENFDSNRNGGTVGLLGKISGRVTNASTNVGDMVFYSSTDGSATAEAMRVTRNNTLKLTGELERPTNAYMTEVGTYQANTTNIGGTNGKRYIAWNNSTTNEGLTHTGSSSIPTGSLWTKTSAGQGHYRINVVLGCDSMTGSTRSVFCLYVYTYSNATSTILKGTDKQQYFVGNGYGRALSGTNKCRFGGTIDLYLNQADQFEIVVDKIYGGSVPANLTADVTGLIVERIH